MANNYGAFSESKYPKDNNAGAYQESKKVVFSKTPKPRSKSSDVSRMNHVYKPKASPCPAMNTLNLYGAPTPRKRVEGAFLEKPRPKARPKSNFTYTAPKAPKKRVEGAFLEKPKKKK